MGTGSSGHSGGPGHGRARLTLLLSGLLTLLMVAPPAPLGTRADTPASPSLSATLGSLPLPVAASVAQTVAAAVPAASAYRPTATGVRIALISSGVDSSVLPSSLQSQLTLLGSGGDPVGYGTYAASVILQQVSTARITSIGIYPGGHFNPDWQAAGLQWTVANAHNFDAVVYALPPSSFLDPVSAAIAGGEWSAMTDALGDLGLPSSRGTLFGAPLSGALLDQETRGRSPSAATELRRLAGLVARWNQAHQQVQALVAAGVPVVAAAGDLGPNPQTIHGLPNFAEVVAVGGYDGHSVSSRSGAGPSIDGRVKPDLLAPTGSVGLLPAGSTLAGALGSANLIDPSLEPDWTAGEPQTAARARLDSSISAAALVGAVMAGMSAQGIHDVSRQRGALTAASVPLDGVPVWRQGDGVLRRGPDAAFASSTPLLLGHGDLGAEPDTGSWSATVTAVQGAPASATSSFADFIGANLDGTPAIGTPAAAPPLSVSVTNGGVQLSLPLGDGSYQGGLYCGYTQVSLPGSSGTVSPSVDAYGIPQGTEQLPTCLVKGSQLDALGFYIHNTPAENLTIGLLPSLPVGQSLLSHAMELLPIDPLSTRLFFRVTGNDGHARFPNVPPGYYRVREWSDYGDPVSSTLTADSPVPHALNVAADIGENPGYQSFDALVLSALCPYDFDPLSEDGSPCTQQALQQKFGAGNVSYEKSTSGYLVTIGPTTTRIIFGFLKKMPGPSVASRYIDLLKYGDFRLVSAPLPQALSASALNGAASSAGLNVWSYGPSLTDPRAITATLNPLALRASGGTALGIGSYPFALTTPNYKAHMSLNFSYDLTNALVLAVVVMGDDVSWGVVTPSGVFQLPSSGLSLPVKLANPALNLSGHGSGTAGFDFRMKPRGVSQGTLYLVFLPPANSPLSQATVGNLSFELDTWTNTNWPATSFSPTRAGLDPTHPATGHSFTVSPNYSAAQLSDGCRSLDNGQVGAQVCEDWEVLVHTPKTNAALFDVIDPKLGTSLLGSLQAGGSQYFDPQRGISDFSHVLAFATPTIDALYASLQVPFQFRTNGRFWEQLTLPRAVVQGHPGPLELDIQDYSMGSQSTLFPQLTGPVPVAPYVPFVSNATFLPQ